MLNLKSKGRQRGVSLVELMVGIAIALVLLAGVLILMVRVSTEGGQSVRATKLNQQLRGTLDLMAKDLQRAGFVDWFDAFDTSGDGAITVADDSYTGADDTTAYLNVLDFYASVMPVKNLFGAVGLFDAAGNTCTTNCTCVLFSYDLNSDGAQGVSGAAGANQNNANYELFGFRFDAANNEIDMLTSGTQSCTAGTWTAISDTSVTITSLAMDLVYVDPDTTAGDATIYTLVLDDEAASVLEPTMGNACAVAIAGDYPGPDDTACMARRKILLTLQGQLSNDAAVNATLTTEVKLKNDFLQTQ